MTAAVSFTPLPAVAQQPIIPPDSPNSRLVLTDEPDWNAAEQLAASAQWDAATDAYLKSLRTTQKPWLKPRIASRLLDTAAKASRYDIVITAYITLVHTEPAQVLNRRPALPDADSTYIDTAFTEVGRALSEPNLSDDQKQALLSLQLDLYRIRRDDARADAVLRQLNQLTASPESQTAGASRRFADTKLAVARIAYDRKDYESVVIAIAAARPTITDPQQQEEALYLLAQALDGRAGAEASPDGLKDAALAYMRVVAHFQESPAPAGRRVPDALAACGNLLARLGETKIAADLYEQAAIQYHTRPEAKAARDRAAQLRAAPGTQKATR